MNMVIDFSECVGCGKCVDACNGGAFVGIGKYAVRFVSEDCKGCPTCSVPESCAGECIRRV